ELVQDPREVELLLQVYNGWEPHEPLILHLQHRHGHTVVLEQHTRGLKDGSGQLLALESFALDVTEREEERARYVTAATATRRLEELVGPQLDAVEPSVVIEATIEAICTHLGWSLGHAFLVDDDEAGRLISGPWFDADAERSEPLRAVTDAGRTLI